MTNKDGTPRHSPKSLKATYKASRKNAVENGQYEGPQWLPLPDWSRVVTRAEKEGLKGVKRKRGAEEEEGVDGRGIQVRGVGSGAGGYGAGGGGVGGPGGGFSGDGMAGASGGELGGEQAGKTSKRTKLRQWGREHKEKLTGFWAKIKPGRKRQRGVTSVGNEIGAGDGEGNNDGMGN